MPAVDPVECEGGHCVSSPANRKTSWESSDPDKASSGGDELATSDDADRRNRQRNPEGMRQEADPVEETITSQPEKYRVKDSDRERDRDKGKDRDGERGGRRSFSYFEAENQTEFQRQVEESTHRRLPVFGADLFKIVPTTFAPLDHVPVPPDYVIGPGDELLVRAWGQIEMQGRPVVDRNGQISLPKVGTIDVAGIHYRELQSYLKDSIGRIFRNFELSVTLGKLRSIQVLVVGRARRPGSYTVASFCSLLNAVFAAGGPGVNGSMRHIQLQRQARPVAELDLYQVMKGDISQDTPLQSGDIIYFPPIGPVVALNGSVNFPAVYEIRENTTARVAIETAGGSSALGNLKQIRLESFAGDGTRKLKELDESTLDSVLKNGDILTLSTRSTQLDDVVVLRGNVAEPGRHAWHPGMTVRDLLPTKASLIRRAYWKYYQKLGGSSADWFHEAGGNEKSSDRAQVLPGNASGDDAKPRQEDLSKMSAEINWDYATIERTRDDLSSEIIHFNLKQAVDPAPGEKSLALQDHDIVTIFAQRDLTVPAESRRKKVRIEGEVRSPGVYSAEPGETLRDLVRRAGGLTPDAYLFASDFRRESTRREQQKQIGKMADSMEKDLQAKAAALPKSSADERAAVQEQLAEEKDVLGKLRQTRASGRIVLEVSPQDSDASALPMLPLEDGDRVLIPPRPATVEVVGAVYNQNSFIYKAGKTVEQCLQQSGGGTREADARRLFVVRADGSVISRQMHRGLWKGKFESMQLTPGDTIIMPERIRTGSFLKGIRDWSQVFSQFALGAAALRVISP